MAVSCFQLSSFAYIGQSLDETFLQLLCTLEMVENCLILNYFKQICNDWCYFYVQRTLDLLFPDFVSLKIHIYRLNDKF